MNRTFKRLLLGTCISFTLLAPQAFASVYCLENFTCTPDVSTFSCPNNMQGWIYKANSKSGYNFYNLHNKDELLPFQLKTVTIVIAPNTAILSGNKTYGIVNCNYINLTNNVSISYAANHPHAPSDKVNWRLNGITWTCNGPEAELCPMEIW